MDTVNTFTFANFVPAEPHVAEALGFDEGAEVIKRFRYRRTQDGQPIMMAATWSPAAHGNACPRLLVLEDLPGGLDRVSADVGKEITHLEERVRADLATAEQAEFYNLSRPAPIIVRDHVWYADDYLFHYGRAWLNPYEWSIYHVDY